MIVTIVHTFHTTCNLLISCTKDCQARAWKAGHKQTCPLMRQTIPTFRLTSGPTPAAAIAATSVNDIKDDRIMLVGLKGCDYGFMITTGMDVHYGLPELLAVDVELHGEAWFHVQNCMNDIMNNMIAQGENYSALKQPETMFHCVLPQGDDAIQRDLDCYIDQLAVLLIQDPPAVKQLVQTFFLRGGRQQPVAGALSTTTALRHRRILLLMPVTRGHLWGQVPPAPEGKVAMRNRIKAKLERQKLGLAGFVRMLDGNFKNCHADNLRLVSLEDALSHPEWCIYWGMRLEPDEAEYLKKYQSNHFLNLCLGGFGRRSSSEYIRQVCAVENVFGDYYQRGIKIVE